MKKTKKIDRNELLTVVKGAFLVIWVFFAVAVAFSIVTAVVEKTAGGWEYFLGIGGLILLTTSWVRSYLWRINEINKEEHNNLTQITMALTALWTLIAIIWIVIN